MKLEQSPTREILEVFLSLNVTENLARNAASYLRVNIAREGVAEFYLLAIAKLLDKRYFRILDFYFHALIQQRYREKSNTPRGERMIKRAWASTYKCN